MRLQTLAALAAVAATLAACDGKQSTEQAGQQAAVRTAAASGTDGPVQNATIHDIMDTINEPSADAIWDSVQTISDFNGVHEFKPTTDEDWAKLRTYALMLVEAPNLMVQPGRKLLPPGETMADGATLTQAQIEAKIASDHDSFAHQAKVLQDTAIEALAAIDAKDVPRLIKAGGPIDDACEQCHLQFWYPPKPEAGGANAAAPKS